MSALAADMATERSRRAYRLMAVPYAGAAIFYGTVFVANLADGEIRSGLLLFVLFVVAAAIGLAAVQRWGRSLALIVAIGTAGIGALSLLASILGEGSALGPAVLLGVSVALAYLLTLGVFTLPEETH